MKFNNPDCIFDEIRSSQMGVAGTNLMVSSFQIESKGMKQVYLLCGVNILDFKFETYTGTVPNPFVFFIIKIPFNNTRRYCFPFKGS